MKDNKSCNMLIREICGIWSKCSAAFQNKYGISQAQLLYLQRIATAGNQRMYLKDLEKSMGVGQTSVVRMIDKLETLGMVEKLQDERDVRRKYTRLTKKGQTCCEQVKHVWQQTEESFTSGLTDMELQELSRLLRKVHTNSCNVMLHFEAQECVGGGK